MGTAQYLTASCSTAARNWAELILTLTPLAAMGPAREQSSGIWELAPNAEAALREHRDIIRTMQRALGGAFSKAIWRCLTPIPEWF
jgi:hypothetical protein